MRFPGVAWWAACGLALAGCPGADGGTGDDPDACTNGLPTGSVHLNISGVEEITASYEVPCGDPEDPYGVIGHHLSPAAGEPKVFDLVFTEGGDTWGLTVGAQIDPLASGTFPVLLEGAGITVFTMPYNAGGDHYYATSGTITLDVVGELDVQTTHYFVVSGSFEVNMEHEETGAGLAADGTFSDLLAATLPE